MLHASPDRYVDVTLLQWTTLAKRGRLQALKNAGHPRENIWSAQDSLQQRSCHVSPQRTPVLKCEPRAPCVHLPVLTLIYLHVCTRLPHVLVLCPLWTPYAATARPNQTPLNPSDALAAASRPSVTSLFASLTSFRGCSCLFVFSKLASLWQTINFRLSLSLNLNQCSFRVVLFGNKYPRNL